MAKSVYEMVTDRIISQLENNVIPWQKPWTGIVVFWKIQPVEETLEDGTKEVKQIPLLRYFNVFHIL